jgi:hypothetical protein
MKTKLEIINETVAYYSEDPKRRANVAGFCHYLTDDGRMCAVGRCLSDEGLKIAKDYRGRINSKLIALLKEEYHIDNSEFWINLQNLHDSAENWDDNGLTAIGKLVVEDIMDLYK